MEFQTLSKSKAKELRKLSAKKERDKQGLFIAEGEKCVFDLIESFVLKDLICTHKWFENHPSLDDRTLSRLIITDKKGMESISGLECAPEVIAVFKKNEVINEVPKLDSAKLYLLLDEIQDPGNLGTIIRSCDWFGVYEIFASLNTVDAYGPKVVQASMGSLSRVKVHYLNLNQLLEKNRDIRVVGTLLEGTAVKESDWDGKGFLIMGNEGRGISECLRKKIDVGLTIPPVGSPHPDSLNVAVATAIILYRFSIK